jgi:hypothetical protein
MKELRRTKEEVFVVIKSFLEAYNSSREILNLEHDEAVEKVINSYDDYFEWLQGKDE